MGDTSKKDGRNIVIDNILCYLSTSRDSMKKDDIIRTCLAFYKLDDIVKSKEVLFSFIGEKPKHRRGEDRLVNEVQDIMFVFERCEIENVKLPKFVSDSYNGLPPTSGFEVVAHHIISLIDEISSLRKEVVALKEARLADNILQQNNDILQEDVLTIKGELRKLNHAIIESNIRRNSLLLSNVEGSCLEKLNSSKDGVIQSVDNECEPLNIDCAQSHVSNVSANEKNSNGTVDSVSPSAPEVPHDQLLMDRLLFDEGGPPSAPSFSEVCSRPSKVSQSDSGGSGCLNVAQNIGVFNSGMPLSHNNAVSMESRVSDDCSVRDGDGFQLVQSKKKKKNIIGSKKESNSVLKSAVKSADIFIGNCDTDVTAETLSKYIRDELQVNVLKCESLVTRYDNYSSFKVTLRVNDRVKLLNSDVWPEGIICRKFYSRRTKTE